MCKPCRNVVNLNEQSSPKAILYTVIDIIISRLIYIEGDIYPNTRVSHVLLIIVIICEGINMINFVFINSPLNLLWDFSLR